MHVVVLDTVGSFSALPDLLVRRLADSAVFDRVVLVRWPAQASGEDGAQALREAVAHVDAVVSLPWTSAEPIGAVSAPWVQRVDQACRVLADAPVPTFVFGSSALVYSPSLTAEPVDEAWPTTGLRNVAPSRHLVEAEDIVSEFARNHVAKRVVVLRPALPLDPNEWAAPGVLRSLGGLRRQLDRDGALQFVHVADLATAYERALTESIAGPCNVAADRLALRDVVAASHGHWWNRSRAHGDGPSAWVSAALRSPLLDTRRAERDLNWRPTQLAADVVRTLSGRQLSPAPSPAPRDTQETGAQETAAATDTAGPDAVTLYEHALGYFGQCVETVTDGEWETAAWPGASVRELVALAALDQYRLAGVLENGTADGADLPMDPLGVSPADGWRLAAERVRLSLGERAARPLDPDTAASLRDGAFNLLIRGWAVTRTAVTPPFVPADLAEFTRAQAEAEGGAAGSSSAPSSLSIDELFASVLAAHPPTGATAQSPSTGGTPPAEGS